MFGKTKTMQKSIDFLQSHNDELNHQVKVLEEQVKNLQSAIKQKDSELEDVKKILYTIPIDADGKKLCDPYLYVSRLNHATLSQQWDLWDNSIHSEYQQKLRQDRAKEVNYTPLSLDPIDGSGTFRGSYGDYTTTLCDCTCTDFNRRHLPCKHMYRLAYELDLFLLDDVVEIPEGMHAMSMSGFKERLRLIPKSYYEILRNIFDSDSPLVYKPTVALTKLIDLQIIQPSTNVTHYLNSFTKDQLLFHLPPTYKKSIKKTDLIVDIEKNHPEVIEELQQTSIAVEPSITVSHIRKEIAYYLSRSDF